MISQTELLDRVQPLMKSKGVPFKKYQNVFARPANEGEIISTVTTDGVETTNQAKAGDFIVKNQTGAREMYILTQQKFQARYTLLKTNEDGFSEYYPIGKITALELTTDLLEDLRLPHVFHFQAPWGEAMIAKKDDFLACPPSGGEVYRIARKEFFETYVKDGD